MELLLFSILLCSSSTSGTQGLYPRNPIWMCYCRRDLNAARFCKGYPWWRRHVLELLNTHHTPICIQCNLKSIFVILFGCLLDQAVFAIVHHLATVNVGQ